MHVVVDFQSIFLKSSMCLRFLSRQHHSVMCFLLNISLIAFLMLCVMGLLSRLKCSYCSCGNCILRSIIFQLFFALFAASSTLTKALLLLRLVCKYMTDKLSSCMRAFIVFPKASCLLFDLVLV